MQNSNAADAISVRATWAIRTRTSALSASRCARHQADTVPSTASVSRRSASGVSEAGGRRGAADGLAFTSAASDARRWASSVRALPIPGGSGFRGVGQLLPDADQIPGAFRPFDRFENEPRIFLLQLIGKDRPDLQRQIQKADQQTNQRGGGDRSRARPEADRDSAPCERRAGDASAQGWE